MVSSCFKCRSVSDVRSFLNVISVSSAIVYLKMTSVIYLMNISNIPIVIFVFWPNKNWFNSRLVTPRPVPSCQILSPRRSESCVRLVLQLVLPLRSHFAHGTSWHIMAHLCTCRLFACSPVRLLQFRNIFSGTMLHLRCSGLWVCRLLPLEARKTLD